MVTASVTMLPCVPGSWRMWGDCWALRHLSRGEEGVRAAVGVGCGSRSSILGSEELAGSSWVCGVEDGLWPWSPSPAALPSVSPVLLPDICLCPENLGPCLFLCSTEKALLSPLNV